MYPLYFICLILFTLRDIRFNLSFMNGWRRILLALIKFLEHVYSTSLDFEAHAYIFRISAKLCRLLFSDRARIATTVRLPPSLSSCHCSVPLDNRFRGPATTPYPSTLCIVRKVIVWWNRHWSSLGAGNELLQLGPKFSLLLECFYLQCFVRLWMLRESAAGVGESVLLLLVFLLLLLPPLPFYHYYYH